MRCSYARCCSAGAPFEVIARQLGHRDVAMVAKVYGRFKPDTESAIGGSASRRRATLKSGLATLPRTPPTPRNYMKKAPQLDMNARLRMIAGAGLEPATPAL